MRDKRLAALAVFLVATACACAPARGSGGSVEDTGGVPEVTSTLSAARLDELLAGLVEAAEDVRGLQFGEPLHFELVDRGAGTEPVTPPALAEHADRAAYAAALAGLLGTTVDTGQVGAEALDRVLAGEPAAYDPTAGRVLVARPTGEPTPYARVAIVREILLALIDQHFAYEATAATLAGDGGDRAAALRGLAEGDAEYFTGLYVERHLQGDERLAVQLESLSGAVGQPESEVVADFRRGAGAALVRELVSVGGAPAVDAAYTHPPATSEQVYHPARYMSQEAGLEVPSPEFPVPAGYRSMSRSGWGELGLRSLFEGALTSAEALQASTGWGGDSVASWWDGEDVLVVAVVRGDSQLDTEELDRALRRWALKGLEAGAGRTDWKGIVYEGAGAYAFVGPLGEDVLLVAASDPETGERVRDSFFPQV